MPDIYQGTELWDLSLVDPDNRRPVDYEFRKSVLNDMQQKIGREEADLLGLANELLHTIKDGRVKLYVIHQTLKLRRNHDQLLTDGDYLPARSFGEKANHLCSYLRHLGEKALLVAVPRLVNGLLQNQPQFPFQNDIWKETWISLPHGKNGQHWRNVFTGQRVQIREKEGQPVVYGGELFRDFPVFLGTLERTSGQG